MEDHPHFMVAPLVDGDTVERFELGDHATSGISREGVGPVDGDKPIAASDAIGPKPGFSVGVVAGGFVHTDLESITNQGFQVEH
jgi:hypothetical protein